MSNRAELSTSAKSQITEFVLSHYQNRDVTAMPDNDRCRLESAIVDSTGIVQLIESQGGVFDIEVGDGMTVLESFGSVAPFVEQVLLDQSAAV